MVLVYRHALWALCFSPLSAFCSTLDPSSLALPRPNGALQQNGAVQNSEDEPEESEQNKEILVQEMQGLILVGHPEYVIPHPESFQGVACVELDIPGGSQKLIQRLEPIFLHSPLTRASIDRLKREIILYYREQHHPVVMVFVPEQTVSNGILQLVVIEAELGKVVVKGDDCFTSMDCFPEWVRIESGDTIDERILLQDVSWMNTNPFRRVNVLYTPGEVNGTSDIELLVTERRPWRIYGGGDNTGTPLIGKERWFVGCNVANVFAPNNIFTYQYTTSSNFRKFQSHTFQYLASFPWRNSLSIFGGYATANPSFGPFTTHAKTSQISARYTMPQWWVNCSRYSQLNLDFGFDYKTTNNNLIFGEDNIPVSKKTVWISQLTFSLQHAYNRNWLRIQDGLELFWSPGRIFRHQSNEDFESLRPGATASYFYGKFSCSHEIVLPYTWSFWGQGRLQLSNASLLASEQFSLGGFYTVRGYDERIVNGDSAYCLNLELRSLPFSPLARYCSERFPQDSLVVLAFLDVGRAWDHEQIPGFPKSQTLVGTGPGLRYHIGAFFSARFDIGIPLLHAKGQTDALRIHFSALFNY